MYPGTVDISKAIKLTELIAGSGAVGYQNSNLTVLAIGNNTLFRRLNVMNCSRLTQPIDVSGCENIEEIYAQGTSITSVKLPTAGRLSQLYLPGTITSLTIRNQSVLTQDGFELAGISNLSTVYIENTNGIDSATLINRCLASSTPILERVRLIGVDWRLNSLDTLVKLAKLKGLDVNGINTDKSVITGKCHVLLATSVKLAEVKAAFPELTVTYTQLKPETVTTFVFGSAGGKSITNAVFECNFDYTKVSETTYKITAQDNETITFTFKCDNHVDYSNSYLVAGTRTQNYSVTYIPLRTIRVKVYNQSVYLQGAAVVVNGKKLTSDANGYVTYRGGEAVSGTVEAFGYAGNTFSFSAITSDTTNTIEVYVVVEIKFVVKDNLSTLVQGATVTCESEQGITNLYGECTLLLGKGTYEYKVTHPSYFEKSDSLTVYTSGSTVNVSLVFDIEKIKPIENGNIQMLLCGTDAVLTIESTTVDYVIDWGDGTADNASGIGDKTYNHTYATTDRYQVEVRNCANVSKCNGDIKCLVAYWSIGNSNVSNLSYANFYKLAYVGLIFRNDAKRASFYHCFSSCQQLISIPSGLFDNCPAVTSFYGCFSSCYQLTSIPSGLFDNCTMVTNFGDCFRDCEEITSIPAGLFDNCTMVTNFYGCLRKTSIILIPVGLFDNCTLVEVFGLCFLDCNQLTSIPSGLFDNCTMVTSFSNCFVYCKKVTSDLPRLWIQYYGKTVNKIQCFTNCTSASNWLEVPVSWGGTALEYVPPVAVSNYMMADYRALEARIRNIELQQNMDKN